MADYFVPAVRGRVYGLLQITAPFGYIIGMVLATILKDVIGWRGVFYVTGSLGIVLSILIFRGVHDVVRGSAEPELQGVAELQERHFEWRTAARLLRKRSLVLVYLQGFFGVFPWNAVTYWFFRYLEKERGYSSSAILVTMITVVVVLAAGYPLAGMLGDRLFRRPREHRRSGGRYRPVLRHHARSDHRQDRVPGHACCRSPLHPLRVAQYRLNHLRRDAAGGPQRLGRYRELCRDRRSGIFTVDHRSDRCQGEPSDSAGRRLHIGMDRLRPGAGRSHHPCAAGYR
jgi:MFS family permease